MVHQGRIHIIPQALEGVVGRISTCGMPRMCGVSSPRFVRVMPFGNSLQPTVILLGGLLAAYLWCQPAVCEGEL